MSSVASSKGRENISDFERGIYNSISDSMVKYLLNKEWLDSEEINEAIVSVCDKLKKDEMDKDVAYEIIRRYLAVYIELGLNSMIDNHFLPQRRQQFDFGSFSFSERSLRSLV